MTYGKIYYIIEIKAPESWALIITDLWDLHQKKQVGSTAGIHRQPALIPGLLFEVLEFGVIDLGSVRVIGILDNNQLAHWS